jgi:glycosyltransferase involved in cell wall biosynthesis
MKNPLISVIIPTRNEENYIEESLLSLKNQTYQNIEIIVVDDVSVDRTVNVAKRYVDRLIIKKTNIPQAKNLGVKSAKGDIFLFMDSDNILLSSWVENALKDIDKYDAVIGAICPKERNMCCLLVGGISKCFLKLTGMLNNVSLGGIPIMTKKDFFEKIDGFNESFASYEDVDFINKIKKNGKIKLNKNCLSLFSARRTLKQGYLRYTLSWLGQSLYYFFKREPFYKKEYPIFR